MKKKKKEENSKEAKKKAKKTRTKASGKLSKEGGGDNYLRQRETARPEFRQQDYEK